MHVVLQDIGASSCEAPINLNAFFFTVYSEESSGDEQPVGIADLSCCITRENSRTRQKVKGLSTGEQVGFSSATSTHLQEKAL